MGITSTQYKVRFTREVIEYVDIEVTASNPDEAWEKGEAYLEKLHTDLLTVEDFEYPLEWEDCEGNDYEPRVNSVFLKNEQVL